MKEFYIGLSILNNEQRVENFLNGILTKSERVMISRRLRIARMLLRGNTYKEIIFDLGVGKSTIKSVDNWLNQGLDGYRGVVKELKVKKEKKGERSWDYGEDLVMSFSGIANRYPAHFWLVKKIFNL